MLWVNLADFLQFYRDLSPFTIPSQFGSLLHIMHTQIEDLAHFMKEIVYIFVPLHNGVFLYIVDLDQLFFS